MNINVFVRAVTLRWKYASRILLALRWHIVHCLAVSLSLNLCHEFKHILVNRLWVFGRG